MFRVLLVEDDPGVRNVISRLLEIEGIEVTGAESGDQAIRFATASAPFSVAIVDRVLPGKLGGQELIKALKSYTPSLVAVQMTGSVEPEEGGPAINGPDLFLRKPITRQALLDAVNYCYHAHTILLRRLQQGLAEPEHPLKHQMNCCDAAPISV